VRIGITGQQQRLEKQQAGRPHRRGAAEPREDLLCDHRLNQKQQERRKENRGREQ